MGDNKDKVQAKKKILLVEDEADLCKFMKLRFEREGFAVVVANDGIEGFNKAKQEKPDIVILDLMLPSLPGEEVCKKIRRDAFISVTPIIMLTAKGTDVDKVIGKVIGADLYIIKPFDGDKLIEEIRKLTGEK